MLTAKTVAVVCGVSVLYAVIFVLQMFLGIGPVGATLVVPAGSPRWFDAAQTWVRVDAFVIWPFVIAVGAIAQRLWCRRSRLWTVVFVALPATLTIFGRGVGRALLLGCIYIATAVAVGALASLFLKSKQRRNVA